MESTTASAGQLAGLERYRSIVGDWDGFAEALSRPLPVCVWTNTLRTRPERLSELMQTGGWAAEPVGWYPGAFRLPPQVSPGKRLEYMAGLYHVQEEVSLIPPVLLEATPDDRVLDMCAAPGNKTAQLAVAMHNRGTLVANDRNYGRIRALRRTIDRLGLANVSVTAYDGANYPPESGSFDKVLVDAPCSCEGTTRKHPEAIEKLSTNYDCRLAGTQRALLRKAVQRCRVGGRVVYSTCTYAPEENECIVSEVLDELGAAVRLLPARIEGLRSAPGLTSWKQRQFNDEMTNAMRIWPHQNDTGGFFAALLEKTAEV
ncbi:MAG: RsmB/NOP family class I SAM-dependent RNA methyltransferase [Persicimonas sp.]